MLKMSLVPFHQQLPKSRASQAQLGSLTTLRRGGGMNGEAIERTELTDQRIEDFWFCLPFLLSSTSEYLQLLKFNPSFVMESKIELHLH